jgi:hypothetical protein
MTSLQSPMRTLRMIMANHLVLNRRFDHLKLLSMWMKVSQERRSFSAAMRQVTPSFFTVVTNAMRSKSPEAVGRLLSNICNRAHELNTFLHSTPSYFQLAIHCGWQCRNLTRQFPAIEFSNLKFHEMAFWLSSLMFQECNLRQGLHDLDLILRGFVVGLHSTLREVLAFSQYCKMIKSLQRSRSCSSQADIPAWLLDVPTPTIPGAIPSPQQDTPPLEEFVVDDYQPTGNRISMRAFCEYTANVPEKTKCSICMSKVTTGLNMMGQHPTVTACKHYFHQECLDGWVNESAMSTSNSCPSCRAVLCKARSRVPADA